MYPRKGLITGNIHVKYQSFSTQRSKVISKVNVSERRTENDRQDKTICPPIFDLGGIKMYVNFKIKPKAGIKRNWN